uniref:Uncharacterized protein n=1 Tax=Romanomermis culicivorax TaxID=13658 RepID=A0A915HVX3_ROMCU
MEDLDSIDATELFGPKTRNLAQDESGDVEGNRQLGFMIMCALVFGEVLVNGQGDVCCLDVDCHCKANSNVTEKVDEDYLMQGTRREELDIRLGEFGGPSLGCKKSDVLSAVGRDTILFQPIWPEV